MKIIGLIKWGIALGLVTLSIMNASWIAPAPKGKVKLIATRTEDKAGCASLEGLRRALIDAGGRVVIDGASKGPCVTLGTALTQLPRYEFIIRVTDADQVLTVFDQLKRPIDQRYSFTGNAAAIATIRARAPKAWVWSVEEGRACFNDYPTVGWIGTVPASCAGKTMLVETNQKWKIAGWPKRFLARMENAGTRVIMALPDAGTNTADRSMKGVDALMQIPQVPIEYDAYLWVEDIALIGPAIRG